MGAIHLKVVPAEGEYDLGRSKFLGRPTLPEGWSEQFGESVLFLVQIRLEEIKDLDPENLLPHTGYLYFFLDTEDSEYNLKPIVRYYPGEPTEVIDEFNSLVPGFESFTSDWLIEFEPCDEGDTGNKLLGIANDWNYAGEAPKLLFQYDPLDSEMGFLSHLDGLIYFFFGEDPKDFDQITIQEEIS